MGKLIIAKSNRGAPDPIGLHDASETLINPATKEKQQEMIDLLNQIDQNTDQLELKADQVNLNTDELESKVQEVSDRIGQTSGETIASWLQNIWNKLHDALINGLAKIKIWDGTNQANVTSENRLQVETKQATGESNIVKIKDGEDNEYYVRVTPNGRLLVSQEPPTAPPDTTPVIVTAYGSVATQSDEYFTIPNGSGVVLTLQRLSGGSEQDTSFGSAIELWYDPDGDMGVNAEIIDVIFANGTSDQHDLNQTFIGDGTARIVLRRIRFSGGSKVMFGRLEGYY